MNYRVYEKTVKSRRHNVNEDRMMFSEYTFMRNFTIRLMVVADGMGGLEHGDQASHNALTGFLESFYTETIREYTAAQRKGYSLRHDIDKVREVMVKSVKEANRRVCRGADRLEETGSTISAVCVVDDYAVVVNVGDSPIYYYDSWQEELTLISRLQTEAELRAENGEYERYSREYYADEHRLTNYLGGFEDLEEEDIGVYPIDDLKPGDVILLGSDGSFGRMSEDTIGVELEESLKDGVEGESVFLKTLFHIARMDKDDDQTAIMYIVTEEDEPEAEEEE